MKRIAISVGVPFVLVAAMATVGASPSAQATDRPKVSGLFSGHMAPAFWVECRNLTRGDLSLSEAIGQLRIDGVDPPKTGGRGSSGPPTQIAPRGTFRGIIVLEQPSTDQSAGNGRLNASSMPSGLSMLTTTEDILTTGRHTIAVQCLGVWSDAFEFYWVASPKAKATVKPKNGFVPNAATAITIAVAIWEPLWGAAAVAREKPYRARLSGGIWTVEGGALPAGTGGGTALAEISQYDGRVLRVIHGQ